MKAVTIADLRYALSQVPPEYDDNLVTFHSGGHGVGVEGFECLNEAGLIVLPTCGYSIGAKRSKKLPKPGNTVFHLK